MENKLIISIFGQMNHGKSTLARLIQSNMRTQYEQNFYITPFAKGIKDIVETVYGFSSSEIDIWKRQKTNPPGWIISMREALQKIGTECFRAINPNTWIDLTLRDTRPIIVDDGRFINEAKAVKKAGGLNILIYRYKEINITNHPSEKEMLEVYKSLKITRRPDGAMIIDKVAMNDSPFDILVSNDGSVESLTEVSKSITKDIANLLRIRKPANVTQ